MNTKGTSTTKRAITPKLQARNVSSSKTKTDASSDSGRKATLNRNSPAVLRASASNLHTSSLKSAGKDGRSKLYGSHNALSSENHLDEAKLDSIDYAYNSYISSIAAQSLLSKSQKKIKGDIDKQLSALQKRVNESLQALEDTRSKLNTVCLLQEQTNLLKYHKEASRAYSKEPAFTKDKCFSDLMTEIDRIQNQLPSKNISLPESSSQIATFQKATSQLLQALEMISTAYGSDQSPISQTASNVEEIKSTREAVQRTSSSLDVFARKASSAVINEAILSTSDVMLHELKEAQ